MACELQQRLGELAAVRWQQRPDPARLLVCYGAFAAELTTFGPRERAILHALDLDMLAEPAWWTRLLLLAGEAEPSAAMVGEITALNARLAVLLRTVPKLVAALTPEPIPGPNHLPTLTLRLPAQASRVPQTRRLAAAIEAVTLLWEVLAHTTGATAPLTLASCTPLPEPNLVFRGDEAVMAPLKSLLATLWEHVVTHRGMSSKERDEQIPPTLPIMQTIRSGGAADGPDLRDKALRGLRLFLQAGAVTPDMDDTSRFAPARLLRADDANLPEPEDPEPAGIVTPSVTLSREGADLNLDSLIAEERSSLARETSLKRETNRAPRSWVTKRQQE